MMATVAWNAWTYRSYVEECSKRIKELESKIIEAHRDQEEAEAQLQVMVPLGLASQRLPPNYGEVILARRVIAGVIPRDSVAENIQALVDEMTKPDEPAE